MAPDPLAQLVAEVLGVEHGVTDETGPETEPAWDSMAQIEIIISVEETFGVSFSADQIASIRSVGQIRRHIADHGSDS